MDTAGYRLGRLGCMTVAIFLIVFGIPHRGEWPMESWTLFVTGVTILLGLGIMEKILAPSERPSAGPLSHPKLSQRVQELALDPRRRTEAIQAHQAETGITSAEAEAVITRWLHESPSQQRPLPPPGQ
jgi:hypothetical protein